MVIEFLVSSSKTRVTLVEFVETKGIRQAQAAFSLFFGWWSGKNNEK